MHMHIHFKKTTTNDQGNQARLIPHLEFLMYSYGKQQLESRLSCQLICFSDALNTSQDHLKGWTLHLKKCGICGPAVTLTGVPE